MANAPKPTTVAKESSSASNLFAVLTIPICIAIGVLLFIFVLGDPNNFIDNNSDNHPVPGNYAGMAFKGGPIVAILMGMLLMVFVFSVERFYRN
jgi:biopolymer transport protein ExbB